MIVHVYCDERYPDYGLILTPSSYNRTIEISTDMLAELEAASKAYDAAQDKLAKLYHAQERIAPAPKDERITQAELDAIRASTPVESDESIQAAIKSVRSGRAA